MRIVYFGSPEFSVEPLKRLVEKGYEVVAVCTNCDKPVGRKQVLTPTAVKVFAKENGIKVLEYKSVRKEGVEDLKALSPDLFITCCFGQILSKEVLDIPTLFTINLHASILPKFRGATPVSKAISEGERETGITVMKTDEGIDTGDIAFCLKTEIGEDEDFGEVFSRLSFLAADAVIMALEKLNSGTLTFTKQDTKKATYTKITEKKDCLIDFNNPAFCVKNFIRSLSPEPSAFCYFRGEIIKIHKVEVCSFDGGNYKAGEIVKADKEFIVACKEGFIKILFLTKQGGKKMDAKSYLNGAKITLGEVLGE